MIAGRNIICFASNWFYDPTSKHHVMRVLSHRNQVIWVNYHGSRRPAATAADLTSVIGKLGQFVRGPRRVAENIVVVTPAIIPLPGIAAAEQVNRALMTRQIRTVLGGLPERPVQVGSFAPDGGAMRGAFGEELFVYYCVDEFSEFAGYDGEAIRRAEQQTLDGADLVVTTSVALFESKRQSNRNTFLVPHGVDFDHFASSDAAVIPDELADLDGTVLGFFGMISEWVDRDLLAAVARARPDWTLVLIGEVKTDVSAITGLKNVRLLGRRPYSALPGYCRRFDAGMIPFRMNALTRAVNPIKLREYLAAGMPVAATPLPELKRFASMIELGATPTGFVAACERALSTNDELSRWRRRAAMSGESWEARVSQISTLASSSASCNRPAGTDPPARLDAAACHLRR